MAVQSRREGPIDYILAGLSGAATGAVAGLESRRKREAGEAAARQEAETNRLNLSLKQQNIDIQRMMGESLVKNRLDMLGEQRRTSPDIAKQEDFIRLKKEKAPLTPEEEELQKLDIEGKKIANKIAGLNEAAHAQKQANEDRRVDIAEKELALANDRFNYTKTLDYAGALADRAEAEFDFESKVYLQAHAAGLKNLEGSLSDDEKTFINFGLQSIHLAMEKPTEARMRMAEIYTKKIDELFKANELPSLGKPPKWVKDKSVGNYFGIFNDKMKLEDKPGEVQDIPIPIKEQAPSQSQEPPLTRPTLGGLDALLQHPGAPPAAEPAPEDISNARALFDDLDRQIDALGSLRTVPAPTTQPAPKGLSEKGLRLFNGLVEESATTISPELRQKLIDSGIPEADIKKIEEGIKLAEPSGGGKKKVTNLPESFPGEKIKGVFGAAKLKLISTDKPKPLGPPELFGPPRKAGKAIPVATVKEQQASLVKLFSDVKQGEYSHIASADLSDQDIIEVIESFGLKANVVDNIRFSSRPGVYNRATGKVSIDPLGIIKEQGDLRTILFHEIGHAAFDSMPAEARRKWKNKSNHNGDYANWVLGDFRHRITSTSEWFAEIFSAWALMPHDPGTSDEWQEDMALMGELLPQQEAVPGDELQRLIGAAAGAISSGALDVIKSTLSVDVGSR